MKLSDLQPLDIVELRDGRILMVMLNSTSPNGLSLNYDSLMCRTYLSRYNDELCYKNHQEEDIVAVFKNSDVHQFSSEITRKFILNALHKDYIPWTWVREEPKKEMTVEEIEAALGYKIKIVGEHTDLQNPEKYIR